MTKHEKIDDIYGTANGYKGMSDLAYQLLENLDEESLTLLWEARCKSDEEETKA